MRFQNTEKFLFDLRQHVRQVRIKSGDSQNDFANRVDGLHQSAIARYETGNSVNIGVRTLYDITRASNTPLSELIRAAEGNIDKDRDEWMEILKEIRLLSDAKRKWLLRIVKDVLNGPADN